MDPTDPERYDRLHELFAATCDLEPRPRTVILDRECAGDPTLRQEVETMLDQDAASRDDASCSLNVCASVFSLQ